MNNDYYVYIYWRLDTNEPFYVGKGKGRRWKDLKGRNEHFNNIINKYHVIVTIEKDNLTESEAFYWEEEIIRELVFEYGYSIDIFNNYSNNHYLHLVNQTWGGDGNSGWTPSQDWRERKSESMMREGNPMYGKNPWDYMTEETKEKTKKKLKKSGKEIRCNKTEEELKIWNNKISESLKGRNLSERTKRKIGKANKGKLAGKNNPMYNIHRYGDENPMYGKSHTEETKKKQSEVKKGKNNPNSKAIICLTTYEVFFTIKEAEKSYKTKGISSCCRGKRKSVGKLPNGVRLVWMYLEEFLNKCEYILL